MSRRISPRIAIAILLVATAHFAPGGDLLPTVPAAGEVLKNFHGEYSYGGLGLGAESNDAELALWIITQSPQATRQLTELYPQCGRPGKAYVLAALWHADKTAFRALTNDFCQDLGVIVVGSGCVGWSLSPSELVAQMQDARSPLAFRPSRKPSRRAAMTFFGGNPDVYEELRRECREEMESKERALEALASNPRLAEFTNLFLVDDAEAGRGSTSGVHFFGAEQWSAHFLPRTPLSFDSMVEAIFPKSNGVVQVGITPTELLTELKQLVDLPFLKELNQKLPIECVRIRAAGDRLHWDSNEAAGFETKLQTGVALRDWVHFIVDLGGKPNRMISFYHPRNTDLYVVEHWLFENPNWREQYRRLTGKKSKKAWESPDSKYVPVVDRTGRLQLVLVPGEL